MKNLLLLFSLIFMFSCNQDEEVNDFQKEDLLKSLVFEDLNDLAFKGKDPVSIVIFEVTIARASKNCKTGFGFCDFTWFPGLKDNMDPNIISVKEELDTNGNYFEIHFANEIPIELSDEDLLLLVDESLTTYNDIGESFTINSGEYLVDRTLGEYGGYKVYLN